MARKFEHIILKGNLGAGTESPANRIHLVAESAGETIQKLESFGNVNAAHFFGFLADEPRFYMQDTAAQTQVKIDVAGDSWFKGGNVGIGTATPSVKLNVSFTENTDNTPQVVFTNNGTGQTSVLGINSTSTGNPGILLQENGVASGNMFWSNTSNFLGFANLIYSAGNASMRINSDGSFTYHDGATGVEKVRFDTNGEVGIGTATPGFILDVVSSATQVAKFKSTAAANMIGFSIDAAATFNSNILFSTADVNKWYWGNTASNDRFHVFNSDANGNAEVFTILQNGDVGVGTSGVASSRLHIKGSGNTSATRSLKIENSLGQPILYTRDSREVAIGIDGFGAALRIKSLGNTSATDCLYFQNSSDDRVLELLDNGKLFLGSPTVSGSYIETVSSTTSSLLQYLQSFGGRMYLGLESSVAGTVFTGTTAYATILGTASVGTNVQFATNNIIRQTILDNGNIGIGTTSPSTTLHVVGDGITFDGMGGFTGSEKVEKQAGVQTTDATITNIATIATSNDEMIVVKGIVSGFRSTFAESYGSHFFAVFYNNGGTLAQVSTTDLTEKHNFSGSPTVTVDFTGTTVRIRVTGEAAKTINWTTTYEYQKTLTNA